MMHYTKYEALKVHHYLTSICEGFKSFVYVLPLEIQLSRGEGWDPINWFYPHLIFVPCLSQARTWVLYLSQFYFHVQLNNSCWWTITSHLNSLKTIGTTLVSTLFRQFRNWFGPWHRRISTLSLHFRKSCFSFCKLDKYYWLIVVQTTL
jgi:hypothetical protein